MEMVVLSTQAVTKYPVNETISNMTLNVPETQICISIYHLEHTFDP
jgi:hypothetical protein